MKEFAFIRAITFDLDDTLWDVWPTIERAERRLHDWLAEHYPKIPARYNAETLRGLRQQVLSARPDIAHDMTSIRRECLRLAAQTVGYSEFDDAAAFAIFHAARNDVLFFADAVPALERLALRYRLGALSNGNADIKLVGLDHVFDFAISAADAGCSKPDPLIFETARRRLQLEPEQILHVGDDPHTDIWGAAQAGWRTAWVNRNSAEWDHMHRFDVEVETLSELETLLPL